MPATLEKKNLNLNNVLKSKTRLSGKLLNVEHSITPQVLLAIEGATMCLCKALHRRKSEISHFTREESSAFYKGKS